MVGTSCLVFFALDIFWRHLLFSEGIVMLFVTCVKERLADTVAELFYFCVLFVYILYRMFQRFHNRVGIACRVRRVCCLLGGCMCCNV